MTGMDDRKIIYATDYSPASRVALEIAALLARETGATLLIAHVSDREPYPVGELFDEEMAPDPAELNELNAVVPLDPRVKCEHRLLYGEPGSSERVRPADVLLKLAEQEHAVAIVVGTHGRTGLMHILMGGVAEEIVRRAPRTVITVKQSENKRESPDERPKNVQN